MFSLWIVDVIDYLVGTNYLVDHGDNQYSYLDGTESEENVE